MGMFLDMKNKFKKFLSAEVEGIGVVEIILILVVLIGLVIIFREEIEGIINSIFSNIKNTLNNSFELKGK